MKKIEAIIRPVRLEAVKAALADDADVAGMTVSDVRGFSGREEGESFFGADFLAPKVKIELVVADERVQPVIDLLLTHARTGASGDGKIFVVEMDDAMRIRTGDRGDAAVR
jgi:nitrogen regulatory protein P-II 1